MKTCAHCGKAFGLQAGRPGRPRKYCSPECCVSAQTANRSSNAKPKPTVTCRNCGQNFTASHADAMYCSQACQKQGSTPQSVCLQCGVTFKPKAKDRTRFCSRQCAGAFNHAITMIGQDGLIEAVCQQMQTDDRFCGICGQPMGRSRAAYCEACTTDVNRQKAQLRYAAIASAKRAYPIDVSCVDTQSYQCAECGQTFIPLHGDTRREYCSQACMEKRQARMDRHTRRARMNGVGSERFDPREVFDRDGYRCQLCGRKTRPDRSHLDPLYPTLDHIQPLSKGGSHTRKNTQCACRECNTRWANKVAGKQLRLCG